MQVACIFFTLVSYQRQAILTRDDVRLALRQAVLAVREKYPFEIMAWVLLPDHLHTIWRLPEINHCNIEQINF